MNSRRIISSIAGLSLIFAPLPATAADKPKAESQKEFLLKNYPTESLKRGEEGRVGFELTIDSEGRASECLVTQSSGFAALDDGTCEFVARYVHLGKPNPANGPSVKSTKAGYINWKLPPNVTPIAAPASLSTVKNERLICKPAPVSGSVIKKVRRCMSEKQWAQHDSQTRAFLDESIGITRCNEHGC